MSKNISEEKGQQPMANAAAVIEKKARQLAYDTRYQVKKEVGGKKVDPASMKRFLLQRLQKSSAEPAVKVRAKQMLLGEDYIAEAQDIAVSSVASAMFKVFVEGVKKEEVIELSYETQLSEEQERKYKIRVTDLKTGNSYVRYATREKITQLRSKGLKVEMTEHGEPREGERKRGEETARATGGGRPGRKKLDPVGREDSDVDNDGKPNDSNDKYIMKRRAAIGKAIATRNEEFLADGTTSTEGQNARKIDVMKTGETNKVTVFPKDSADPQAPGSTISAGFETEGSILVEKAMSKAQQRFMGMVYAAKKGEKPASPEVAAAAEGMTKKEAKKFAKTKHKGLPEKVEEAADCECDDKGVDKEKERDTRGDYAKTNLIKNKLRAMGAKNPIVMVASEEVIGENEDKERKGTDYRGRDYGPGPKPTVKIPFEGVMQGGWLKKEKLKKA
jgi:hypothetical protein